MSFVWFADLTAKGKTKIRHAAHILYRKRHVLVATSGCLNGNGLERSRV